MTKEKKTAILVVSFGTSHHDTCAVTIDAIEEDIRKAFPSCTVYRAWTSRMIMAKLLKRDHLKIDNVCEAMETMLRDGVTDVIVQPTHVINGIENDRMREDALSFRDRFASIRFGAPLLTSEEDTNEAIAAVVQMFPDLKEDEVLVLMGHGTTHYANAAYAALDYAFKDKGYPNIFLGTVEAYPSMASLKRMVEAYAPQKVTLAPFMIVAGEHAKQDMSGEDDASWYRQFRQDGYEVECVLKGLGEYPAIRNILISHVQENLQ